MSKKLLQITDNIHESILLSRLESELISTPYFYRLHDVYQNSTVYMTYPSNRTKRYEHSLGCMEITSSMLFSAIANSNNETKKAIFEQLYCNFEELIDILYDDLKKIKTVYHLSDEEIKILQKEKDKTKDDFLRKINSSIDLTYKENLFNDEALNRFQLYLDNEGFGNNKYIYNFLYSCLLEAMRIAALFHDVGHPPFSHNIETVLKDLYNTCIEDKDNKEYIREKRDKLIKKLEPFFSNVKTFKPNMCFSKEKYTNEADPHERIGLALTQKTLKTVIPQFLKEVCENNFFLAKIVYYLLVSEFVIKILTNHNNSFHSFHTIIDGVVDSDRLDYIMRDSVNSGVNWGKIPYKRIISHSKFQLYKENNHIRTDKSPIFVIAFPKKTIPDINDLLVMRYKIFARINLHHRCVKTASVLQSSIKLLSENYLKKEDGECINKDISFLWCALYDDDNEESDYKILQWNDSWLVTTLATALIKLENCNSQSELKQKLEEILLNKKIFYSLIKHGSDSDELFESIMKYANIPLKILDKTENEAFKNRTSKNEQSNFPLNQVSELNRTAIINEARERKNLEFLTSMCGFSSENIKDIIEKALEEFKIKKRIKNFQIIMNDRSKDGLPDTENTFKSIFLQQGDDNSEIFDIAAVSQRINVLRRDVPWFYLYVVPSDENDKEKVFKTIKKDVAKKIGSAIREKLDALYCNEDK